MTLETERKALATEYKRVKQEFLKTKEHYDELTKTFMATYSSNDSFSQTLVQEIDSIQHKLIAFESRVNEMQQACLMFVIDEEVSTAIQAKMIAKEKIMARPESKTPPYEVL